MSIPVQEYGMASFRRIGKKWRAEAQKLSPLELARMLGHKSLKTTLIYYNEDADSIADKLG